MLGMWVQVKLEVPHGIPAIGQKRDLLIHLMPLRPQDLEEAPFWFRIQGLHKTQALAGRDLLLVVSSEGEDTFADNDFELLPFLLPVADIAAIDADGEGAIGDGQSLPISGTALHKGPPCFTQFVFAALGHRPAHGSAPWSHGASRPREESPSAPERSGHRTPTRPISSP